MMCMVSLQVATVILQSNILQGCLGQSGFILLPCTIHFSDVSAMFAISTARKRLHRVEQSSNSVPTLSRASNARQRGR